MSDWLDAFKLDSWHNLLTGLGTLWDKGRWTVPRATSLLDPESLEALFIGDAYARRVVEDPVNAALRQGFEPIAQGVWQRKSGRNGGWTWYEPDPEKTRREAHDIKSKLQSLGATEALSKLFVFGRLLGREAILIGADDGQDLSEPLNHDAIRDVLFLESVSRRDFNVHSRYEDELSPSFGEPKTWKVNRSIGTKGSRGVIVHESRLLISGALLTSRRKRMENEWCDVSVLQPMITQLQGFNSTEMAVGHMMLDSSQAVLKLDGFTGILAGKDKDTLRTRMEIIDRGRSVSRIMPIDADKEAFEYIERGFAGVHDIIEKRQQLLAGSVGWPVVMLFGREPAGLSATGDADIRAWYDKIHADRTSKYQPVIEALVRMIAAALDVEEPLAWTISWPSLWQESTVEKATRQKLIADTDMIYLTTGVLESDEVATARFGDGEWSDGAPVIDMELREALREQDLERIRAEEPETQEAPETSTPAEPEAPAITGGVDFEQATGMLKLLEQLVKAGAPQEATRVLAYKAFEALGILTEEVKRSLSESFFRWYTTPPEEGPKEGITGEAEESVEVEE